MPDTITFCKLNDPYGFMSNFAPFGFIVDGKKWSTVEHYYQAQKFQSPELQEEIRSAKSPSMAAEKGRDKSKPLRPDWDTYKIKAMYRALTAKFTQNPNLAKALLATDDALLVEYSKKDSYWGNGGDGSGQNMLGKVLMRVRRDLKELREKLDDINNEDS